MPRPAPAWANARTYAVVCAAMAVGMVAAALNYASGLHNGVDDAGVNVGADFVTFWAGSSLALAGRGATVYDPTALIALEQATVPGMTGGYPWFYPPAFLLAVLPLALLPYLTAYAVWVGIGLVAFVLALRPVILDRRGWWALPGFPGLWMAIAPGQNSLLTGALAGGALVLLRRRPYAAGVLIGLLAIKPQLAVLFPVVLVATKQWRAFASAAATAVVVTVASLPLAGGTAAIGLWFESLRLASRVQSQGLLPLQKMPSTFAWLAQLHADPRLALGLHLLVALAAAAVVVLIWRRTADEGVRGASLMLGTFLALPYSFDYDMVWLAFPVAWLAFHALRHGWRPGDLEILVALWALPVLQLGIGGLGIPIGPAVLALGLWLCWRRRDVPGEQARRVEPPEHAAQYGA